MSVLPLIEIRTLKRLVKELSNLILGVHDFWRVPCEDDKVVKTEILHALKELDCNNFFANMASDNIRFFKMFPDSQIAAANYSPGKKQNTIWNCITDKADVNLWCKW